jgi:hypothetical protein
METCLKWEKVQVTSYSVVSRFYYTGTCVVMLNFFLCGDYSIFGIEEFGLLGHNAMKLNCRCGGTSPSSSGLKNKSGKKRA